MIKSINQVSNAMIASHFEVDISDDGFSAYNANGRRFMLSDLRQDLFQIEKNRKAKSKNKVKSKAVREDNVIEVFELLKSRFPDRDVLIRKTQPGIKMPELGCNVYCIVGYTDRVVVNMDSTSLNKEQLHKMFESYDLYDRSESSAPSVTLSRLTHEDLVEVIEELINSH